MSKCFRAVVLALFRCGTKTDVGSTRALSANSRPMRTLLAASPGSLSWMAGREPISADM
jgi:hypothetical protein